MWSYLFYLYFLLKSEVELNIFSLCSDHERKSPYHVSHQLSLTLGMECSGLLWTLEQVKGYRSTFDKLLVLFALHFKYVMNIVCIPFTNHKLQNLHQQQKSGKMEADELFAFRILCFIPAIMLLQASQSVFGKFLKLVSHCCKY